MSGYRFFAPDTDPALFRCTETGVSGISHEFVLALDKLRAACGFPFVVTSGIRSKLHSREAHKDAPGTHVQGIAADIAVKGGFQRRTIVEKALELGGFHGIGVAKEFVHVDTRDAPPVMWTY